MTYTPVICSIYLILQEIPFILRNLYHSHRVRGRSRDPRTRVVDPVRESGSTWVAVPKRHGSSSHPGSGRRGGGKLARRKGSRRGEGGSRRGTPGGGAGVGRRARMAEMVAGDEEARLLPSYALQLGERNREEDSGGWDTGGGQQGGARTREKEVGNSGNGRRRTAAGHGNGIRGVEGGHRWAWAIRVSRVLLIGPS